MRGKRLLTCVLVLLAASCGPVESPSGLGGDPSCPPLSGVSIDHAPMADGLRLTVGETRRLTVKVGVPSGCPSAPFFPRVSWSYPTAGAFEVRLVSCPCGIEYERDDSHGHKVLAQTAGPGTFVFDVVARKPGWDLFSVAGYIGGPCGGKPGDPLIECGPYAMDFLFVRVADP